jgi:hypothetical protein
MKVVVSLKNSIILFICALIFYFVYYSNETFTNGTSTYGENGSRGKTNDLEEMWGLLHPPKWRDSMLDTV